MFTWIRTPATWRKRSFGRKEKFPWKCFHIFRSSLLQGICNGCCLFIYILLWDVFQHPICTSLTVTYHHDFSYRICDHLLWLYARYNARSNFFWTRESLIYLWAFLHYYLFFPPSSNEIQISDIVTFGYDGRFYSKRSELHFGYPSVSKVFRHELPEEGYFQDYWIRNRLWTLLTMYWTQLHWGCIFHPSSLAKFYCNFVERNSSILVNCSGTTISLRTGETSILRHSVKLENLLVINILVL